MVKIAICDDDPIFLKHLAVRIKELLLGYQLDARVDEYSNGKTLVDAIKTDRIIYDVVFLDLDMPQIDGFSVAEELTESLADRILVFVTNMANQATEGYLYNAFRFIIKDRLESSLDEAIPKIVDRLDYLHGLKNSVKLKVVSDNVYVQQSFLKDSIVYLEAEKDRRVRLVTKDSEYQLLVKPLVYYQELLKTRNFEIIRRMFLINFDNVTDIRDKAFIMTNGDKIPLGNSPKTVAVSKEKYMKFMIERKTI